MLIAERNLDFVTGLARTSYIMPNRTVSAQDATTCTNLCANMLGWPAVSVPCGLSRDRLPVGPTVMMEAFADEATLGIAGAHRAAGDWHHRKPEAPVT